MVAMHGIKENVQWNEMKRNEMNIAAEPRKSHLTSNFTFILKYIGESTQSIAKPSSSVNPSLAALSSQHYAAPKIGFIHLTKSNSEKETQVISLGTMPGANEKRLAAAQLKTDQSGESLNDVAGQGSLKHKDLGSK